MLRLTFVRLVLSTQVYLDEEKERMERMKQLAEQIKEQKRKRRLMRAKQAAQQKAVVQQQQQQQQIGKDMYTDRRCSKCVCDVV